MKVLTRYRVTVGVNPGETMFCAYGGHCQELALDRASQYDWAHTVIVEEYKQAYGGYWDVVHSREGVTNGILGETGSVPDDLVGARRDRGPEH